AHGMLDLLGQGDERFACGSPSSFDLLEVMPKGRSGELVRLRTYLYVPEARCFEELPQPGFGAEGEKPGRRRRLRRHVSGNDYVNPGVVGPLRNGVDGHGGTAAATEHAAELGEAPRRIGEEHEPQAAQDRIETLIGKAEGLAVL